MSELISGKEALIALANGEDVEAYVEYELNLSEWQNARELLICDVLDGVFDLRLKPRTIKINGVEVPAPFKPKSNEICFILTDEYECGYTEDTWTYLDGSRPVWRTEAEIKQVVAALRSVFNESC